MKIFAAAVLLAATPASAQMLSADQAEAIVKGCAAHARAKGQSHAIAVVDLGGHPVATWRMDGNAFGMMDFSLEKARAVAAWHADYDIWLTPTLGAPPPRNGSFALEREDVVAGFGSMTDYVPFTAIQNATGQPAINVPLWWTPDGLPMGTQFVGRVGEEALLLQLATQLEAAQPWFDRRPVL